MGNIKDDVRTFPSSGIIAKLDYIQSTGANTISLSPFYKLSHDAETDTHIVDHKDVDPIFGNLTHFRMLINETHARGKQRLFNLHVL